MQKFFAKLDWVLLFRLFMAISMIIVGFQSGDYLPMVFGGFFALYSLVASKYKVGCGYQGGCGIPRNDFRNHNSTVKEEVEFIEIK